MPNPIRTMLRPSLVFAVLAAAAMLPAQDQLLRAATIVVADDTVLTDGALLLRDGKVAFVGGEIPAEARARATVLDFGKATVVPGFVVAATTLGQEPDLADGALPFTPDLRVAEAFDPWQAALTKCAPGGVTALGLSPSPRSVAGGLGALVKPGRDRGRIAAAETFLALSLAGPARNPEREPTSLMGAKNLLRSAFAATAAGTATGPDAAVLRSVLQGSRRAFLFADSFAELSAALDLAREFRFEPVLVGGRDAAKVLPRLSQQRASIVLPPLSPDARPEVRRLPAALAEAGVPFCFGGNAASLRLSAALAVRAGLDRKVALQALTRTPAQLLDQAPTIGSLRAGAAADCAVFGGDPLDLDAPHLATLCDGALVFGAIPNAAGNAAQTSSGGR